MIQPRVRKVLLAWTKDKNEIHIDPTSGGLFVGGNDPIVADAGKANACIRQMLDANLVETSVPDSTTFQITERGVNEAGEESHRRDMLRATGMKIPGLLHKNIPSGKAVLFSVAVRTALHDVELLNLACRLSTMVATLTMYRTSFTFE